MRSFFTENNKRTQFPPTTDRSILLSFNQMISQLTNDRFYSIQKLNAYKDYLSTLKKNVYITTILKLIESLLLLYTITPIAIPIFPTIDISIKTELTSTLYTQFLENENIDLDPMILTIFKEIKSKNII